MVEILFLLKFIWSNKRKMNEVFIIGKVIETSPFKFIIYKKQKNKDTKPKKIFEKHQSVIEMKIELAKGGILKAIAYDEKADYVLRNNFQGKVVFINGKARPEFATNRKDINVIIKSIQTL